MDRNLSGKVGITAQRPTVASLSEHPVPAEPGVGAHRRQHVVLSNATTTASHGTRSIAESERRVTDRGFVGDGSGVGTAVDDHRSEDLGAKRCMSV